MVPVLVLLAASSAAGLGERMASIAAQTPGHIGAAAMVIESGERAAVRGRDRFPMQSVYKLPIAMAVLRDVDRGKLALDRSVRIAASEMVPPGLHSPIRDRYPGGAAMPLADVLRYAVTESDGTASDVLLRLAGGPARVTAYLEELGVHGVRVMTTDLAMSRGESVQYRNWAQPDEMLALLGLFWEGRGLSAASRARLLEWMTVTTTGLKRLRGQLPERAVRMGHPN
jgi:beta-lactamase class A